MKFTTNDSSTVIRVAVHPGTFHADDVFAVAFATLKYSTVDVQRTANPTSDNFDIVADVGREYDGEKYFDHHQGLNPDEKGIIPSAVTLLCRKLFPAEFEELNERFLRGIAAQDNGQADKFAEYPNVLGSWVHLMNPRWDSTESLDEAFEEAVKLAIPMAQAALDAVQADVRADGEMDKIIHHANGKIFEFERYFPWVSRVSALESPLFVLFPGNRGGWNVQCVPPSPENPFGQRLPLPEDWANGTNVPCGMTFCHKGRFLAAFDTRENALEAILTLV